ncbi:MAG: hypothetical protein JWO72_2715 [Caulobacteraceae bacterium]|nr:hypothetical protein [Caulobacteraceae bacterium]
MDRLRAFSIGAAAMGLAGCVSVQAAPWAPVSLARSADPLAPPISAGSLLYGQAVRAIRAGDFATALDLLQMARVRGGDPAATANAMGVVYDKLGRFDLSRRYYALAAQADPGSKIVEGNQQYSALLQRELTGAPPPTESAASSPPSGPVMRLEATAATVPVPALALPPALVLALAVAPPPALAPLTASVPAPVLAPVSVPVSVPTAIPAPPPALVLALAVASPPALAALPVSVAVPAPALAPALVLAVAPRPALAPLLASVSVPVPAPAPAPAETNATVQAATRIEWLRPALSFTTVEGGSPAAFKLSTTNNYQPRLQPVAQGRNAAIPLPSHQQTEPSTTVAGGKPAAFKLSTSNNRQPRLQPVAQIRSVAAARPRHKQTEPFKAMLSRIFGLPFRIASRLIWPDRLQQHATALEIARK